MVTKVIEKSSTASVVNAQTKLRISNANFQKRQALPVPQNLFKLISSYVLSKGLADHNCSKFNLNYFSLIAFCQTQLISSIELVGD